jgi:hypothetical protein
MPLYLSLINTHHLTRYLQHLLWCLERQSQLHYTFTLLVLFVFVWSIDIQSIYALNSSAGPYVYRHYDLDAFQSFFHVLPITDLVSCDLLTQHLTHITPYQMIDPDVADWIHAYHQRQHGHTQRPFPREQTYCMSDTHHQEERWLQRFLNTSQVPDSTPHATPNTTTFGMPRVYIRWSDDILQWGLYAAQPLSIGEPLGIYAGIVTNKTRNTDYAWSYGPPGTMIRDGDGQPLKLYTDGKYAGNYLRFVNHRPHHQANLASKPIYRCADRLWRILYVAIKPISIGEQFFIDYGPHYWQQRRQVTV